MSTLIKIEGDKITINDISFYFPDCINEVIYKAKSGDVIKVMRHNGWIRIECKIEGLK